MIAQVFIFLVKECTLPYPKETCFETVDRRGHAYFGEEEVPTIYYSHCQRLLVGGWEESVGVGQAFKAREDRGDKLLMASMLLALVGDIKWTEYSGGW